MRSRNTIWQQVIKTVANIASTPPVLLHNNNILLDELGKFRLGINIEFDGTICTEALHMEPILKASEAKATLDGLDNCIVTTQSRWGNKEYVFRYRDQKQVAMKPFNIRESVPDGGININEKLRDILLPMKNYVMNATSTIRDVYSGIFAHSRNTYFASGSFSYSYIRRIGKFPARPLSFIGSKFLDLLEECETAILFRQDDNTFAYLESEAENYEVLLPFETVQLEPTPVLMAYEKAQNVKYQWKVNMELRPFCSAITEILNDAKYSPTDVQLRLEVRVDKMRIVAISEAVQSTISVSCISDYEFDAYIKDPGLKGLAKVYTYLGHEEGEEYLLFAHDNEEFRALLIPRNTTYICVVSDLEEIK